MDNVKCINQFLSDNNAVIWHFFQEYPNDTIKIPPPHIAFRIHDEINNAFKGISLKYFRSFVVASTNVNISGEAGGWFLYIRPEHLNPFLSRTKITDDGNVLDIDKTIFYNGSTDEEKEMCKDILAYIKAGVQTFYHKEEK